MAKGDVEAGSAVSNQFTLEVVGLPAIYFTRVGELTVELAVAEMADGTWQSTGRVKPGETEADQYVHHEVERVAMEAWFTACRTGAPGHKTTALLHLCGADGNPVVSYLLDGVINRGRKLPEHDKSGDGEGVRATWMLAFDDVVPM